MEISHLFKKEVYTDRGIYVGKVVDAAINFKERRLSGLSLIDINQQLLNLDSEGAIIPFRWVMAAGDIIIIKELPDMYSHQHSPSQQDPSQYYMDRPG